MLLLGADEAGKGPVIGSMFVAGLVIEEEKLFDLAGYGVKDSKKLARRKGSCWPRRSTRLPRINTSWKSKPRSLMSCALL